MKKYISLIMIILSLTAFTSCKKKGVVVFCEGVDKSGKAVNTGTIFTTGDLTASFTAKSGFGTDSLIMKIYNTGDGNRKPLREIPISVNPDSDSSTAPLELYDEGIFRIVIEKKGEIISEGQIEIIDSINR